jgi:ABC-type nitrate/sulfonate/bicarbonate transport system substrate-binding protein
MRSVSRLRIALLAIASLCELVVAPVVFQNPSAQKIKLTVGQTGINPGTSLYFIAQKESLYAKHGLDVEIVATNTTAAVQAMLGGTMQMSTGSGAAAFITATAEGAPGFALVSSWVNVFPYTVMVQKNITSAQDLKGKVGHVGAPFGAIPDVALRVALTKLGLDPEKDVRLVQIARPDPANIIAQLERGDVQFGPLAPPFDRIAENRGFRPLISLPDLKIPWQNNGEWVQKSYLKSNRETVLRFTRVIADAIKFYFDQKEKSVAYISEFLGIDQADAGYAYQTYAKWVDKIPRPKIEGIQSTIEAIKKTTPKAANADPASFIDVSLIDQLNKEGYFK